MEELKAYLEKLASRTCWTDEDDFSAMDYAGGNFDDAYNGGVDDGETQLARELLSKYFKG